MAWGFMETNVTVPYSEQIDFLSAVRALIADEAHWCLRSLARDVLGREVDADADNAAAWCIMGAFVKVGVDRGLIRSEHDDLYHSPVYIQSWQALSSFSDPVMVNDFCGHDAVLSLLDSAIAKLKGLSDG
jgi:hypothetical protein